MWQKRFLFISFLIIFFVLKCNYVLPSFPDSYLNQEKLEKHTLENGLTVILKRISSQELVSIEALIKTGSAKELEFLGSGISHFLEHLLFKGTKTRKPGDIDREIKNLGGQINAFTGRDYTAFQITLPRENLFQGLELLYDCLNNPAFDSSEFEKERQVILKEMMLNEDSPQRKLMKLLWLNLYSTHPYRHPIIGYPSLFKKLNVNDLRSYHSRFYVPNNMILVICGDFEPARALEKIKNLFSSLERAEEIYPVAVREPPVLTPRFYQQTFPTKLTYLALGFPGVSITEEDSVALDLLAVILGGGEDSRLVRNLKHRLALVYSISSYNFTPKDRGVFLIQAVLEEENLKKVKEKIFLEIEKIKKFPIKMRELISAKKLLKCQYYLAQEKVQSQAQELAVNEFLTQDIYFSQHYLEKIEKIKPLDLKRVAKRYLKKDKITLVVLSPEKKIEKVKREVSEEKIKQQIEKFVLPNGLRILLYQNSNTAMLNLRMTFLGGVRQEDKDKNGICNLMVNSLARATKKRNSEKILEELQSLGTTLDTFSGNNSFGISIDILSKDLEKGLDLLTDIITNPVFPEPELEKEKERIIAQIKAQEGDPLRLAFKLLRKNLYLIHPYGMSQLGEIETVKRLTRTDIMEFYKKVVLPSNCVIAIFGNIDKNESLKKIKKYLASWKVEDKMTDFFKVRLEPKIEQPRLSSVTLPKNQAVVTIGFHTVTLKDKPRYAFEVLNASLSGAGNRLYERIRGDKGLAYMVGSFLVFGIDPGYICLYVATEKKNLKTVEENLLKEVEKLFWESITEQELTRAKNFLIGENRRKLQTNFSFSLASSLDELYGLGFDNYKSYEEKIKEVSAEDMREIIKTYLKKNSYALVRVIPE